MTTLQLKNTAEIITLERQNFAQAFAKLGWQLFFSAFSISSSQSR